MKKSGNVMKPNNIGKTGNVSTTKSSGGGQYSFLPKKYGGSKSGVGSGTTASSDTMKNPILPDRTPVIKGKK